MAAFRCDNYGFICKLSLPLMLRDIKISSNATIREDHILLVYQRFKERDSHDAKGLSITTHLDSSALWRPRLHAVPLKTSGRKYLHFPIRLDIQTSRRFYQRGNTNKGREQIFYCHLFFLKQTRAPNNCLISLQSSDSKQSRFICCK